MCVCQRCDRLCRFSLDERKMMQLKIISLHRCHKMKLLSFSGHFIRCTFDPIQKRSSIFIDTIREVLIQPNREVTCVVITHYSVGYSTVIFPSQILCNRSMKKHKKETLRSSSDTPGEARWKPAFQDVNCFFLEELQQGNPQELLQSGETRVMWRQCLWLQVMLDNETCQKVFGALSPEGDVEINGQPQIMTGNMCEEEEYDK